ncbi:MAG: hypothetical protein WBF90_13120 [Rivularia sp. (in: cyanobacteria)]
MKLEGAWGAGNDGILTKATPGFEPGDGGDGRPIARSLKPLLQKACKFHTSVFGLNLD